LTQDSTKPTENIPPAPVTNDKPKDPDEKGSPIASKDLQDQFNNNPSETDPNKPPAETPTPTKAPATPSTYAAALTAHTTPTSTPEEDFLTQGGFTIHEMDKRKRSTSTTNSPSPSLRSPDAKQSKLFQKGHSPHRRPVSKTQAPPPPKSEKPVTQSPATPSSPPPKDPTKEEHTDANHPDGKETPKDEETGDQKANVSDKKMDDGNPNNTKDSSSAETTEDKKGTPPLRRTRKKKKRNSQNPSKRGLQQAYPTPLTRKSHSPMHVSQ